MTDKVLAARFDRMPEHEVRAVLEAAHDAHGERAARRAGGDGGW